MGVFTTIACLLAIAAIFSFVNDRYLHLQSDIGLLLMAGLTAAGLRVLEVFVPFGLVDLLHQITQSFNLNDTLLNGVLCFILFRGSVEQSVGRHFVSNGGWFFGWLSPGRRLRVFSPAGWFMAVFHYLALRSRLPRRWCSAR